ncbi:inorganic diphosphatase [Rickettsia endosymbiont of Cardiosporidium cionae]|uniref:inorganic diphosphatase n=1 Tax=Rickettsia endosymbiont of Cardiosporidium cionae TaxID=2777155 RepID=UPI0018955F4C|nr:inorganic diphosphatase [Rickettsia endosymbiont of Cardiosporidium cionae]KAF8818405.1 inorganic diphosphatase [Rickettsia endosymbiont of Cardiosporidium cionae]
MFINKISAKQKNDINVVIEIPMNNSPVKYEFNKASGFLFVDRFIQTSMFYPYNYGFIPNTLSPDGDPLDVLVISNYSVIPGAVLQARPIGVLMMEDESGFDEKILSVPTVKLDPSFEDINDINDLHPIIKDKITHFFKHYKNLEENKWVKILGWKSVDTALKVIDDAVKAWIATAH